MNKFIKKTNSNVGLSENDSVAIADADQSTNISIGNEVVDVIMNKLIDKVCDKIESNNVQMGNMNNEKENTEKNDEDAFSASVDKPLIDIVSTDIGYLHFNIVTKFPVITDTLRKNLTVKGPDNLQNQDKIGSANIREGRRLTKCFFTKQVGNDRNNLILRRWLHYSPKDKSLNCFYCLYMENKIVVEAALQHNEDFANGRRVKRYLNVRQVNLIEILSLN